MIMSENRPYSFTVKIDGSPTSHTTNAPNRARAVQQALLWFWKEFKGKQGLASECLVVADPYSEVVYTNDINCNDKNCNYLDEATLARVITESGGILERDTNLGTPHHPRRSLRRVRRRREKYVTVAPNIMHSSLGVFYYRAIKVPQVSHGDVVTQTRKMQNIRLEAKNLADAIGEIRRRKLRDQNQISRPSRKRSLKFVAHVAGVAPLTAPDDLAYFAPVLKPKVAAPPQNTS